MTQTAPLNGILCINKPQGFTSFDVIAKLRGITRTRKIGHSGTLDPMATGVLPVFFGNATKACDLIPDQDKVYRAGIRFGLTTDTQDIWGKVLTKSEAPVERAALEALIPAFTGDILQVPPMYSALQVGGQRLYDLARKGIEVERKPRPVTVYSLSLLDFDGESGRAGLEIACSKGTYIRTICHDMGEKLGTGAVMDALVRTKAAGFSLSDCLTLEEVEAFAKEGALQERMLPVERLFSALPRIRLNPVQTRMFQNGVRLDLKRVIHTCPEKDQAVYGSGGEFLGLARCREETGELVLLKLFSQRS